MQIKIPANHATWELHTNRDEQKISSWLVLGSGTCLDCMLPGVPSGIVYWIKTFNHKKSLMFKYSRMQKKISSQLVCMLPHHMPRLHVAWGQSHCWAVIYSAFKSFMPPIILSTTVILSELENPTQKTVHPISYQFSFLTG